MKSASLAKTPEGVRIIKLCFKSSFKDIERIKLIKGRIYHKQINCWSIPLKLNNIKKLINWGFEISPKLKRYYDDNQKQFIPIIIDGLNGILKKFQNEGVQLLDKFNGNALLADEMGLGKTIQAIAYLQWKQQLRPAVIVVPAGVKLNWELEILKWMTNVSVLTLYGETAQALPAKDIYIINYNILPFWAKFINRINPAIIIADECHFIKNNKAKRSQALKRICHKTPHKIFISGTPIENNPFEIWNAWRMIDSDNCPDKITFGKKYCDAKYNGFSWDFSGASNLDELYDVLSKTIMIRRLKKDVLTELPEKTFSFIPCEIDNKKEYFKIQNEFISFLEDSVESEIKNRFKDILSEIPGILKIDEEKLEELKQERVDRASAAEVLVQMEYLKQTAVKGKLKQSIQWIEEFLESGNKLVVFARHKFVIDALMAKFGKIAVKIDGSVNSPKRKQEAINAFQNTKKIKLCIISEAGGYGITLTAAHDIVILEYPPVPGKLDQIIDRVHRMTQKYAVTVYYLMAIGTIEEKIAKSLDEKRKIITNVLDGKDVDELLLLENLINDYGTH